MSSKVAKILAVQDCTTAIVHSADNAAVYLIETWGDLDRGGRGQLYDTV